MGRRTKKFEKPWFRQHLVLSDQRSTTFLKLRATSCVPIN